MQAVYIDTRDRNITAHAVWVTQVEAGGLVIREGVQLPGIPREAELYLIDETGYHASSSDGHVDVKAYANETFQIWGELMIGKKGLRPVAPRRVYAVSNGSYTSLKTHQNSNCDVAATTFRMLAEYFKNDYNTVLVMEGQSDKTTAFTISGKVEFSLDLPEEHRVDVVNRVTVQAKKVMDNHYWSYYNRDYVDISEKHKCLMNEAVESLMDAETSSFDKEVAAEIVRRLSRKGIVPDGDKANELVASIVTAEFIEAHHEDDERLFTWAVPDELVNQLQPGSRVKVDTCFGESLVTVSRVFRGSESHNHRAVIEIVG